MDSLISIIVPIYNAEKYLDKCIKSIVEQTYYNLEIILIDDGSNDNSSTICDKWQRYDKRIIVVHNDNNGVSYSRNCGLNLAKGEYILFIDSDDFIEKNYVERLYSECKYSNIDLVICACRIDYLDKTEVVKVDKNKLQGNIKEDMYLLYNLLQPPYCKLYRKDIIKDYNIKFPEYYSFSEDRIFNYKYLQHVKKYKYISDDIYHYCQYNVNSLSKQKNLKAFSDAVKILYAEKVFLEKFNAKFAKEMVCKSGCFYITLFYKLKDNENNYFNFKKRFEKIRKIIYDSLNCNINSNIKRKLFIKLIRYNMPLLIYIYFWIKENIDLKKRLAKE